MICRLYVDLQSAVCECNVLDAYKQCLKLIDQVQKADDKDKAVPIAVLLCPLKVIIWKSGGVQNEYQDVDSDLIDRCGRIWDELERVNAKLNAVRTSSKKQVVPLCFNLRKYKELVKKSLKNAVIKARENGDEEEIEKVANIIETHPLFKPNRLERWLRYKQAESEIVGKITGASSTITFFAYTKTLVKDLDKNFDKKYALVHWSSVPPLDEKTNEILAAMKDYVDITKLSSVERDDDDETDEDEDEEENDDDEKVPWHMIQRKRKQLLAKIRELTDHVEKNKHLTDQVPFCITFEEAGQGIGCRYSVYKADNLLKGNLGRLPGPPTNLRIADIQEMTSNSKKNSRSLTIRLERDYENLGFPCSFLVEYQLNISSDASWT